MLLAVLSRRAGIEVASCDVFVNVAGGMRIEEPASDLPVALAIASSLLGRPVPSDAVAFGEIGLAGEVRGVARAASRLAEARTMGFSRALMPATSAERLSTTERQGIEILPVRSLDSALDYVLR